MHRPTAMCTDQLPCAQTSCHAHRLAATGAPAATAATAVIATIATKATTAAMGAIATKKIFWCPRHAIRVLVISRRCPCIGLLLIRHGHHWYTFGTIGLAPDLLMHQ